MDSSVPRLIALDSDTAGFVNDLEMLDRISPRSSDTVHIFYAKSGQKSAEEILANVASVSKVGNKDTLYILLFIYLFALYIYLHYQVHPHFLEFLSTLGWPVNVWRHPGWTGHVTTSWRGQTEPMTPPESRDHGGAVFNGDHYALYWADAASEIAFVVPTARPRSPSSVSQRLPESQDHADGNYKSNQLCGII